MPMQARRNGRSIAPIHLKPRHCKEKDGQDYTLAALPLHPQPGKDPSLLVRKVGWVSGLVWMDTKNLAPNSVSIPGPSSPQLVTSQTELSWPPIVIILQVNISRCLGKHESTFQLLQNDCSETARGMKFQSRHLKFAFPICSKLVFMHGLRKPTLAGTLHCF